MTIQEFFDAYLGLWIETNKSSDQSTNDQCVDLWRTYYQKVIGAPDVWGNAVDFWTNYQTDHFDRIENTPNAIPQLGDVIIWGIKYSKKGHIAVATDIANLKTFISFDENDPAGEPCSYVEHTYSGVLGWLRPKNQGALVGQTENNVLLQVLADAFNALPKEDKYKEGNLEGYLRGIIEEHKPFAEYDKKAKILDGFISKWVMSWQIKETDGLSEIDRLTAIEQEMDKMFGMEKAINELRDAAEKAVGKPYDDDESLIKALGATETEIKNLKKQIVDYQNKLSNKKVLFTFTFWDWLIKICDNT